MKMLKAVGLDHSAHLYPDEISGGMQKRLGIARALIIEPEVILYDEPTAGLDPITSRSIADLMIELQEIKKTTMVIDGRALVGSEDYLGKVNLTKNEVGVFETGYKRFRTFYDGVGGFFLAAQKSMKYKANQRSAPHPQCQHPLPPGLGLRALFQARCGRAMPDVTCR